MVVCEVTKGEDAPRVLAAISQPALGITHGYITNMDEAVQSIRRARTEAEHACGFRIKSGFLAVGSLTLDSTTTTGSVAVARADGEITESDVTRANNDAEQKIENIQNIRVIQSVPLEYKVGGKTVPGRPLGMKGAGLETKLIFIHALEQHIEDLIKATEHAGLRVEDVVPAPLAASVVLLSKRQMNAGCMLVDLGAETLTMSVFEHNLPLLIHTFSIGSHEITKSIALAFKLTLEESERMKRNPAKSLYPREDLADIVDRQIAEFFKLIDKQLKKIGRSKLLPAGVVITGAGSRTHNIASIARETLSLPAQIAPKLTVYARTENEITKGELDSSWGIAYGLCVVGAYSEGDSYEGSLLGSISTTVKEMQQNVIAFVRQFLP